MQLIVRDKLMLLVYCVVPPPCWVCGSGDEFSGFDGCPGTGPVVIEPLPEVPALDPLLGIAVEPGSDGLDPVPVPDIPVLDPLSGFVTEPLLFKLGVGSKGVVAPGL